MGFGVDSSDHPIYLRFKKGKGRTNAQAFPPQMNISPATVYPDVDAAAYVWPSQNHVDEDADSWLKRMMMDYCNKTLDCLNDDSLTASYKVGYSKAYIKGLKRLIAISHPTKN
jgi:hypothetical protein